MKALTLWQPWATMVAMGWKPIENRGWAPSEKQLAVGERFAIHAAVRPMDGRDLETAMLLATQTGYVSEDMSKDEVVLLLRRMQRAVGCVVATAIYDGALEPGLPYHRLDLSIERLDTLVDWWDSTGYGWILRDVLPIDPPIPMRGRQGLWNLPEVAVASLVAAP